MKMNLKVSLFLLVMVISFGCGINATTSKKATSVQNALIANHGVTIASGSANYVGNWSGDILSDLTLIEIGSDGSVLIASKGQTTKEFLVKNNQNEFFITDTKNNQLLSVELYGGNLILHSDDEYGYYFSRK